MEIPIECYNCRGIFGVNEIKTITVNDKTIYVCKDCKNKIENMNSILPR
jgi:predicted metal-binding protein